MEASVRYPELFLPPEERIPESFWISLRYFNFYRIALATVFLGTAAFYDDAVNLGTYNLELFRYLAAGYLFCGVLLHGVLRDLRDKFELQLSLQVGLDIVAKGLETDEDIKRATEAGCRYGQGFALGHPGPAERVEAYLDSHRS